MTYHAYTTLNEIRAHEPCKDGWEKLLRHLGKTQADDEPLALLTVLESNGLEDALWCLRTKSLDRLSRHFQAWCAEQVLYMFEAERPNDMRVRHQIAVLRNDDATDDERAVAQAAARVAALDASRDTSRAASRAASWNTALAAALNTVLAAALTTSRASAFGASRAALEKQLRAMIGG